MLDDANVARKEAGSAFGFARIRREVEHMLIHVGGLFRPGPEPCPHASVRAGETGGRATPAFLVLCAVASIALTACGSTSHGSPTKTLTVLINAAPQNVNPALSANGANGTWPNEAAYGTLIYKSANGSYQPALATRWAYGPGNKTFTLTLRAGVRFSDGQVMTGQTVADSINYYRKANGPLSSALALISAVTATEEHQVQITLSRPLGILPELFSQLYSGYVIGPRGVHNPQSLSTTTDGTGPYQLESAQTVVGSRYTFAPNPYYPGGRAYSKVVITVAANPNAALAAVRTGQADVTQGDVSTAGAAASAGLKVVDAPTGVEALFLLDRAGEVTPALKDVRVRQALNYAVNRTAITSALLGRFGTPTDQPTIPGNDAYLQSLETVYSYNPAKARRLLSEAGYSRGFSVTILTEAAPQIEGRIAQAVAAEWAKVGVHASIRQDATFNTFLTDWDSKKYSVAMFGLGSAPLYVNADYDFLPNGVLNPFGSTDGQLDDLLAGLNAASGTAASSRAQAAEAILVRQAWLVPVLRNHDIYYATDRVAGVYMSPTQWVPDLQDWHPSASG